VLWSGREHEYEGTTDERFSFVRCRSCGLVRLNPRPDVSELGRIYPSDYYAYNLVSEGPSSRLGFTDRMKKRMYQRRFAVLAGRLGKPGRLRVLDIGCADGRLLDWYRDGTEGHRLETHGIELDDSAAETARRRGHRVVTGRFEVDEELEKGSFDLMLALHVIEHVDDPEGFARRAAELLSPGGVLLIATPNWDSSDARRFRGHWGGNHWPRHWTLYDERSLRALAAGIGLEVDRVEYQSNPIFWVWTCHSWLKERFPGSRWPDRLFPPVGIFDPSLQSFLLLSFFSVVDGLQRKLTKRTASISIELRRPL
jgi:2-polyprenyl-3-methyl-5-hydroxy-6-metoxy-1,4-benzoquinol methylase